MASYEAGDWLSVLARSYETLYRDMLRLNILEKRLGLAYLEVEYVLIIRSGVICLYDGRVGV